jgi:predicted phosphate transport protein (TIGR00153 family)
MAVLFLSFSITEPFMKVLFHDFLSHRALFFDLLDKTAKNVVEMAALQVAAVNNGIADEREAMFTQVDKMEHAGHNTTHKIYLSLDKVIFPPLNRDDIHTLAATIGDVADTIKEACSKMYLYGIVEFVPAFKEIAGIILQACSEIEKAVNLLRTSKKPDQVLEICRKIKIFEQQADQVYYHAVAELFLNEKDAVTLIKYREILLALETSANKCKNVKEALNAILINNM